MIASILAASMALSAAGEHDDGLVAHTKYCAGMVFRETPYADMRCTRPLSEDEVAVAKHFELDYDDQGRLIEVRYVQNGALRAYEDRFVRAPRITIDYSGNMETRRFYNEWGHRQLVSGDVYEARFEWNNKNQRKNLAFYGLDGNLIDNDFGIARYDWTVRDDGQVIEHRYNTAGDLVRNRPGFGYMVTRFAYDANGLLARMYNLGADGQEITPDEAGIVMTQISYDRHGQFIQWLNLDANNQPKRGMSDIAEIIYEPSRFSGERTATFRDADGTPQETRWGAHKVEVTFDQYGNIVHQVNYDTNLQPTNSNSGIGQIDIQWTEDGAYQSLVSYFNKDRQPVESTGSGVHAIVTKLGSNGRPQSITFVNLDGKAHVHKGLGYASELHEYDSQGRLVGRRFVTDDDRLANHSVWGVARFEYRYGDDNSLQSVSSFAADGTEQASTWNPAH